MAKNRRTTNTANSKGNNNVVQLQSYKNPITVDINPRNEAQEDFLYSLNDPSNSIVFAMGPAGTGKTMLATMWAIKGLIAGDFDKIIISRPNVAVDNDDIGFLPGDVTEKLWPWVLPIIDVFYEHFQKSQVKQMIERGIIEFCPIAHIRGRTFKNAAILIDEAQNTTVSSMKSILTRIGDNSKMVVTGDIAQSDRGKDNGLRDFLNRIDSKKLKHIDVVRFTRGDVERHPAVKEILELYGEDE